MFDFFRGGERGDFRLFCFQMCLTFGGGGGERSGFRLFLLSNLSYVGGKVVGSLALHLQPWEPPFSPRSRVFQVKWLHENRTEGCTIAAMKGAAENNHLKTLEWLRFNRSEGWTIRAAAAAARKGHLTALAYLLLGDKSERIGRYADGFGGFNIGGKQQKNASCNEIGTFFVFFRW